MIKDPFVRDYLERNQITPLIIDEDRPWGGFVVIEETAKYDKKLLWVNPGQFLSLQFHGINGSQGHNEEWTMLTDAVVVWGEKQLQSASEVEVKHELENLRVEFTPKETILSIPAGTMHAMVNPLAQVVYWLETRTSVSDNSSARDRELDIRRIYDNAHRDGLPSYPQKLVDIITKVSD
jgi:hypothetical protein